MQKNVLQSLSFAQVCGNGTKKPQANYPGDAGDCLG
jgi:hypothetical protein